MDSDWCLFCEKHVMDLGAAYCSKDCARMDKLMSTSKPSASSFMTPASSSSSLPTFKRFATSSMTATYPSMYRSSTLVPTSMSSRGGISKNGNTSNPTATTSIRCLPVGRSSTRRQPLVLYG
ncbi:hypothetical protein BGZ80_007498 [Entomortierella chlamydospora]|uniref:Uncharacterized protein n=1 Tax=Entomortierella chlamydospora TaxID=101097 RepID=A0A9P6MZ96_9FUNG|nr:hypothetical protein BGZ79_004615 [Entomortierella chlamydospora]KAG0018143.1 hypothetical protein BGZ80_007498 [Entomortierella chlamydospora]